MVKVMNMEGLMEQLARRKAIYDALSPEERAEVDDFNSRMSGKSIKELIEMGDHPMKKHFQKVE